MKTYNVFVYGTLLRGEYNHRVANPFLLDVKEGQVKGTLKNVGPYPALTLEGEQVVKGEWFTVSDEGLRNMDLLEGYRGKNSPYNHYERVEITDVNGVDKGFVYVYTPSKSKDLPIIESGSWKDRKEHISRRY